MELQILVKKAAEGVLPEIIPIFSANRPLELRLLDPASFFTIFAKMLLHILLKVFIEQALNAFIFESCSSFVYILIIFEPTSQFFPNFSC